MTGRKQKKQSGGYNGDSGDCAGNSSISECF